MTHEAQGISAMLDAGRIEVAISNGKWWKARRNGATKYWKTRPNEFRIPIKFGFRGTGAITHNTPSDAYRIVEA